MRKILTLFSFIFFTLTLFSCVNVSAKEVLDQTKIGFNNNDNFSLVTTHLTLPQRSSLSKDAVIEWESSNPSVISSTGIVNRMENDTDVTLILRVTLNKETVDKTFYLTVKGLDYTLSITFKVFDEIYEEQTHKFGYFISLVDDPIVEGYRFIGWYYSNDLSKEFSFTTPLTDNFVIEAKFEELDMIQYKIEFYYENIDNDLYTLDNTVSLSAEIDTEINISNKYLVTGFIINQDLSTLSGLISEPDQVTLKIYYDRVLYTINYFSDGVELASQMIKYNAPLTPISTPIKENFDFNGWGISPSSMNSYDFTNKVVTSHLNFYAIWSSDFEYTGYYTNLNGVSNPQLKSTLRTIISNYVGINYGASRYLLDDTDRDPNNINNVILIYNRASVSGIWDEGSTWNREHVFPQSYITPGVQANNNTTGIAADLHNLKPANPGINTSRGNKAFAPGSGSHGAVTGGYYPGDADKGDVARIILYMNVRWNMDIGPSTIGSLDTFLRWHIEDPVDTFEANRNDVIHLNQGNRNPFIDHPDLVERIYGSITLETSNHETITIDTRFENYYEVILVDVYLVNYSELKNKNQYLA